MTHLFSWQPLCTGNNIRIFLDDSFVFCQICCFVAEFMNLNSETSRGKFVFLNILPTTDTQKSTPFLATQWCTENECHVIIITDDNVLNNFSQTTDYTATEVLKGCLLWNMYNHKGTWLGSSVKTLNTQFQSTVVIMLIDKWCCSKLMATQKISTANNC